MTPDVTYIDSVTDAPPEAIVAFNVVCQPRGLAVDEMWRQLSVKTIDEFRPTPDVRRRVVAALRALGFEVFETTGPVVVAEGTVRLFESVFGGTLVKRVRQYTSTGPPDRTRKVTSIVLSEHSAPPSPARIKGAVLIAVAEEPDPAAPSIPAPFAGFALHVPGDVAQLTRASATHRRSLASGQRATGAGVTVAVVDTGFAKHPYYKEHGYRIVRVAAPTTTSRADRDEARHGTWVLAGLFACAPDVHAFGVKYGTNPVAALEEAREVPGVSVMTLTWLYNLGTAVVLPLNLQPLRATIVDIVATGVTVVAAGGNGEPTTFPAMMPEVIAVGGVDVDAADALSAWSGGSSFKSVIFGGRAVPDLCGIAARTLVPVPGPDWEARLGGTSFATLQVAGIAALLLQKNPTLTPETLRRTLMNSTVDVVAGTTSSGNTAVTGRDPATGSGFVDALKA